MKLKIASSFRKWGGTTKEFNVEKSISYQDFDLGREEGGGVDSSDEGSTKKWKKSNVKEKKVIEKNKDNLEKKDGERNSIKNEIVKNRKTKCKLKFFPRKKMKTRTDHSVTFLSPSNFLSGRQSNDHIKRGCLKGRCSSGSTLSSSQEFDRESRYLLEEARELDQVGTDLFERGRYKEALRSYTQALNFKYQALKLRESFDYMNDDNEDGRKGENTPISNRVKKQLLASVATSMNNIGYLHQQTRHNTAENIVEDIFSIYQGSLNIKKKILGKNDLSIGATLNNIGTVYFSSKKYEDAIKCYQQSFDIMVSNLGMSHLDVATVLSNIGDVYYVARELEDARMSYDQALKIRWSKLGRTDPRIARLLERIATIDMEKTKFSRNRKTSEDYTDSYRKLGKDVMESIEFVANKKRSLELEMFHDKIEIICGMRELVNDEK